jgi:hypothetical protein
MSDGSPVVRVNVDTSAVANEVSRLKSDINHVANEVRGVSDNINILQAELLAQMVVTIERITAVKNEVSRSIEAAAQAKIIETATEIFGKIGIITSAAKRISQQYHKSVIRCGRTSEKFDRLNDEVKISYHTDIHRLGKYIFDLWHNHYRKVEDRIQKQHTGFLTTIEHSVEQIRKEREKKLEELLIAVKEKLARFLEQRRNFHDSISMITAGKLNAPVDKIAVPMIIVKKTGTDSAQIKIGHEVTNTSTHITFGDETVPKPNEHIRYSLRETDIFKTYRSDRSSLDKYVRWRDMTPEELNQLEHGLERLVGKNYIDREYYELLVRGLKKSPPKVPEQFDMPREGDNLTTVIHAAGAGTESMQMETKEDDKILGENEIGEEFEEASGKVYELVIEEDEENEDDEEEVELEEEKES